MSNATAFTAPKAACTSQPQLGRHLSEEDVPTIMISSSSGLMPAISTALFAASTAIWVAPPSLHICLAPIPVLERIHSSLVSTIFTRKPGIVVKIKKRRENLLTEYITFDIISLNIKVL